MSRKKSNFWTPRNTAIAGIILAIPFIILALLMAFNRPMINQIDYNIGTMVHSLRTPERNDMMIGLTRMGDAWSQTAITAIITVLLCSLREFKAGIWYVLTMLIGASLLNQYMKGLFGRVRPDYVEHLVHESSYAFPSGHAMGSMILLGGLAFLVYRLYRRKEPLFIGLVVVFCISLSLVIGFTRIYLGVHYPSDVLGGFSLGAAWLMLSISAFGLRAT